MIQTCDENYWRFMENILDRNGDPENPGQPCGKTFDDLNHSTICPHAEIPASSFFPTSGLQNDSC